MQLQGGEKEPLQKCTHLSGLPCFQFRAPIAAAFDSWYPMQEVELADIREDVDFFVP